MFLLYKNALFYNNYSENKLNSIDFLLYNLYNKIMISERLTFYYPTNITIPITVYHTLENDANYFGYFKNGKPNINGFLNKLLPCLSDYRDDLHNSFLSYNQGDEETTQKIEENIYKLYFNKYDYCDDGVVNISLRINQEYYKDFLKIHDTKLQKYNMDFTNYIRSLLIEYTSKRIGQREYFYFYREINEIKNAITNHEECCFYTHIEKLTFVPISIELSKNTGRNLIIGITTDKETAWILELVALIQIFQTEKNVEITKDDCDFAYEVLEEYYEKEDEEECLD
ncbi:MAG: hypothetical protein IJX98_06875 [Clostridia bacterium]|nr:hypothetical protein [Clostridia bacterium]